MRQSNYSVMRMEAHHSLSIFPCITTLLTACRVRAIYSNEVSHPTLEVLTNSMSCHLLDIPWARLDAYSAETEQIRLNNTVFIEPQLQNSAPEWNWWYMLKHIDLETVCK
jgi:hypothetical protein